MNLVIHVHIHLAHDPGEFGAKRHRTRGVERAVRRHRHANLAFGHRLSHILPPASCRLILLPIPGAPAGDRQNNNPGKRTDIPGPAHLAQKLFHGFIRLRRLLIVCHDQNSLLFLILLSTVFSCGIHCPGASERAVKTYVARGAIRAVA